ncbi:hypothetical protein AQPW35_42110 [Rubrivivax pictus]|uniref:Uncharacterized protein n=1 Tax=Pseudaquabacterium pictum TaxID=2315236 RepID=A0A480AW37_9BURK|nr:hypothetical protein AQPW35_42110 [Rubrivivax pictus]
MAHTKLVASRAFWLTAYPAQRLEMLFDAHARGFAACGGMGSPTRVPLSLLAEMKHFFRQLACGMGSDG